MEWQRMKDFDLRFVTRWWSDKDVIDLLSINIDDVPRNCGVYVLGTTDTPLVYPWGTSPIYYIGQSNNLRRRLGEHQKYIREGRQFGKYWSRSWWPRYQYGIAFGADCCWFSSSSYEKTPEEMEAEIISEFYWHVGSTPTANGAWPKIKARPKVK